MPAEILTVETAVEWCQRHGVTTPASLAQAWGVSVATARRKLDGGVYRQELVRDEYSSEGIRLKHEWWRYCPQS